MHQYDTLIFAATVSIEFIDWFSKTTSKGLKIAVKPYHGAAGDYFAWGMENCSGTLWGPGITNLIVLFSLFYTFSGENAVQNCKNNLNCWRLTKPFEPVTDRYAMASVISAHLPNILFLCLTHWPVDYAMYQD